MRRSRIVLAALVLALVISGVQLLLASVPEVEAPAAEVTVELTVAEPAAAEPLPQALMCTQEASAAALNVAPPEPIQLACNCYACFTQCGECGVRHCFANPCDCGCLKCAL